MTDGLPLLFHSHGVPLAGLLVRPDELTGSRRPTVVVTGSWLTVKEQMPLLYARRLVALGFNAFVFDFSGQRPSLGTTAPVCSFRSLTTKTLGAARLQSEKTRWPN
jgi:dienelactone hydrolase